MGHMGNGAHGHNFLNSAGIFTNFLQDIDIDVYQLFVHGKIEIT